MFERVVAIVLGILLLGSVLLASIASNILRDASLAAKRPFSFSRTQLMWWTTLVAFCFLVYLGNHGELPAATESCLALLGMGVGTTATAWVIDGRHRGTATQSGDAVHRDQNSEGFFTDILSDASGLSVHRFQALVFNIIFGASFLLYFIQHELQFPEYGAVEYALLGLSSAGYLGVKALEQGDAAVTAKDAGKPTGGEELIDADALSDNLAQG